MTLREFKALTNSPYEVYVPTEDTNYDVYALRTSQTYKNVGAKHDEYIDKEIAYFEADTEHDYSIILVYLK